MKKTPPPPKTPIRSWAWAYCRVLGEGVFLEARYPCRAYSTAYLCRAEDWPVWHYPLRDQDMCRGTSLTRNSPPFGPSSRPIHRALWWS